MARPKKQKEEPLKNPRIEDIIMLVAKTELPHEQVPYSYGVVYKYRPNPKNRFFREYYPIVGKYFKEVLLPAISADLKQRGLPYICSDLQQHVIPSRGIMNVAFEFITPEEKSRRDTEELPSQTNKPTNE